jgi:group II intron reverse transcriptase/maturase/CRISPR-associated endonuclease Cas1
MPLSINALLPLHGLTVTLRFNQKTQLTVFHSTSLAPFIRTLAGSPENFDSLIKIDAPESGRYEYLIGDCYRFNLYGLNGSHALLSKLISVLQQLPFSAIRDDPNMPFRRNVELEALHDVFSKQPVKHISQLSAYTLTDLKKECQFWQSTTAFNMQLLSPIRLLKDKQQRQSLKGEARYCQQKTDLTAELISNRLYDSMHALLSKQADANPPARHQPQPLTLDNASHLFWLNIHYTDKDSKTHAMGGMMGEIVMIIDEDLSGFKNLKGLENGDHETPAFDWTLWVLGQYIGFGQRSSFGFGRYRLQTLKREASFNRSTPANSLLTSVNTTANLTAALEHIQNNSQQIDNDYDDEGLIERCQNDIQKLLNNNFTPPPLQGFIIDNADNSTRALTVPPFRDRVLQRAVAQIIQPIVDTLHYQHSYGFRTGRSRLNASYAIQAAWREGYRWVYESDIEDFFDSVLWQRLTVRLQALWGDDPLVNALGLWMQAPVEFQGQTIKRVQGLPQGSPLSPLLANIMLDDFDNDMQLAGFKLIRFADDFVVLCKSKEQAQLAQLAAEASLQEHGLKLNKDKTHITSMSDGFYYLGYLFVNDMVLDSPKRLRPHALDETISKHSWLSQVIARTPKAIESPKQRQSEKITADLSQDKQQGLTVRPEPVEACHELVEWGCTVKPLMVRQAHHERLNHETAHITETEAKPETEAKHYGERDQYGLLLCVTGESCIIRTENDRLQVERGEQSLYDVPWRQLHAVLLLGRHNITTPALTTAMEFNIPLHFASQTGKYQGVVWNGQSGERGCQLWLKQQQIFAQPEHALTISREIVGARLFNLRETLRLRAKTQHSTQIDGLINKLPTAQTLAELNGFEGSATRLYFAAFKELLPAEFAFNDRNRQPPLDPFNALLSLGYSLLYSCLETILRTDGLLPWQGVYHQAHGKHATLASDLMEAFRHVVERLALSLIKRRELKPDDFYITDDHACYLKKDPRNFYLSSLMAKFEATGVFELIHQQNLSLIGFIEHGEDFSAWRVR